MYSAVSQGPVSRGTPCVPRHYRTSLFMSELKLMLPPEIDPEEAILLLSIKLYEAGRLSLGQAAELAGYSKRTFLELLGKQGVPAIDYPPAELADELGD